MESRTAVRAPHVGVVASLILLTGCSTDAQVFRPASGPPADAAARVPLLTSSADTGGSVSCAIADSGTYCWGDNTYGHLGTATPVNVPTPTLVPLAVALRSLSVGATFACGLDESLGVWCWGGNEHGQLGRGSLGGTGAPAAAPLPGPVSALDLGVAHACAVLQDGSLHCWGRNNEQQLGVIDEVDRSSPILIDPGPFRAVSAGQGHTCAVHESGALSCWGRNTRFESGQPVGERVVLPQRVGIETDWQSVSASHFHTCGVRAGDVYCWGSSSRRLGEATDPAGLEDSLLIPERLTTSADFVGVDAAFLGTCAWRATGGAVCWGRNWESQFGVPGRPMQLTEPTPIPRADWQAVHLADFHSCGQHADRTLTCVGDNRVGQIGSGDYEDQPDLVTVSID